MAKNHIVKRAGHTEKYDERKVYASVYAACLAVREPAPTAEISAEKICQQVAAWLDNKHEVTSADIKREVYKHFHVLQPDAAWIYQHQRNIS